jgi:hypothetical protein
MAAYGMVDGASKSLANEYASLCYDKARTCGVKGNVGEL